MIEITMTEADGKKTAVKFKDVAEVAANISVCNHCGEVDLTSPDGKIVECLGSADEAVGNADFELDKSGWVEYVTDRER